MAVSDVSICNFALQLLGAKRIASLSEDSRNARSVNAVYEVMRDAELRIHRWNFAITRAQLSPLVQAPAFDFTYAFALPSDCLFLILPANTFVDWKVERQNGQRCILTNQGNSLNIRYVQRVTDASQFDPLFAKALGAAIAGQCCEEITQSNEKKADAQQVYKDATNLARRTDAFEKLAEDPPEDSWFLAQRFGSFGSGGAFAVGTWANPF